jgi:trk system potassium uptake protein TrkH
MMRENKTIYLPGFPRFPHSRGSGHFQAPFSGCILCSGINLTGSPVAGKLLKDIDLPENALVAVVIRDNQLRCGESFFCRRVHRRVRNTSRKYRWDSVGIEAVSLALMVLGNLSFVTAWFLFQGEFRMVIRNGEVRLMAVLIPLSMAAVFIFATRGLYPHLGKSIRVALFETVSSLTTTGFSTVSYGNWDAFGVLTLIGLMLIGGGTCSTAGGIKQFRIYLLWRLLVWEVRRALMPANAILERPIWEADRQVFVDDARVRQVAVFVFLYLATYLLGALLLCACGFSLSDSLFEFASAIGTVGLSIGVTSAGMPDIALWAETFAMFLGRLEFMVVFVSLLNLFRDGRRAVA